MRTFHIGFLEEERRQLEMASDIMHGCGGFYKQLGYDTAEIIQNAKRIVKDKYKL